MSENTTPNLQPESSLPIAPTIGEIDHFRIINKNGESQKATITQVRELMGIDYSILTEQVVHGCVFPHMGTGAPLQVYVQTVKRTFPNTLNAWTSDTNHPFRFYFQLVGGFNSTKGLLECVGVVGIEMAGNIAYKGAAYQLSRSNGGVDIVCNQASPEAFAGKIFYITLLYTKA